MIKIYKTNAENQTKKIKEIEKNSWIHLENPTTSEIQRISEYTNIDNKLFKKLLDKEEVARIETEGEVTLLVINYPYIKETGTKNKYRTLPLGILITENYIITLTLSHLSILDDFIHGKVSDFFVYKKTRFVIQLLFKIASEYLRCLRSISKEINNREQTLYHSTQNKELIDLLNIEKSLVYLITSLKSNDVVLERLSKGNNLTLFEEDLDLLEDAMIENKQGIEMANIYREILTSMTDTYATIISNNLNSIMKFLAGITIVFSIPTMIASFMGMNVPLGFLANNELSFLLISVIAIIVSIVVALILKRKNML